MSPARLHAIRLRATYSTHEWTTDQDGNPDPLEEHGWCDPANPWGTMSYGDQDPTTITLPLLQAAQFVVDFPGGVWHWSESHAEQDYRTGRYTSVTLHVVDHAPTVLALADMLNNCAGVLRP